MRRLTLALFALAPALAAANDCKFTARHDFDVDAAGLKTLASAIGSSDLEIVGVPGLAKVEVRGRACASEEAWLADLGVDQQRSGDRLTVTPRQDRSHGWHWFESSYAYVDLEVRVPAAFAVEVRSGSGDARVREVASLRYDGSSGDLTARKIAGVFDLKLSSGDVDGSDIGSVEVRGVSSGDVVLRDIRGDVRVERVGSGDLRFDNVGGGVAIGSVGSGDVTIGHVDRDVSVESLGSGDVDVSDVGGNFSVRSKGSGDVHHRGVRGRTDVPRDDD
jgi:DUF4097 and DUF4098 domain-containing protein YvlB